MSRWIICLSVLVIIGSGCSKKPAPKAPAPVASPAPPAPAAATSTASETLGVSEDLARQCELKFSDAASAPRFDLDREDLTASDRQVLDDVATCLTTGPLKGRTIKLVGRADPRGTTEYNLGLGARRAQSVLEYLRRLGVPPARMAVNTRGALDAAGEDESGWQLDRRVDLALTN